MAASQEVQDQLALENARHQNQMELEKLRMDNEAVSRAQIQKAEFLRHAKEILIENKRNAPVGSKEITPEEIIALANSLQTAS